jgi:hypothetical protein
MTDKDIETLRSYVEDYEVIWFPENGEAHRVTGIGLVRTPKEEEPEPSDCAYIDKDGRGKYVALYNVELDEFKIISDIS